MPLQLATVVGFGCAALAFLGIPVAIGMRVAGQFVPGVTTTIIAVLLLGGIQLIAIGVIGEYVSRIYDEVKQRPLYLVSGATQLRRAVEHDPGERSTRRRRRGALEACPLVARRRSGSWASSSRSSREPPWSGGRPSSRRRISPPRRRHGSGWSSRWVSTWSTPVACAASAGACCCAGTAPGTRSARIATRSAPSASWGTTCCRRAPGMRCGSSVWLRAPKSPTAA